MHNILSHRDSSAPSPVLSSLPSYFSAIVVGSLQRGDYSFSPKPLPGFEPLAIYAAAESFMSRFFNDLAGGW